MATLVIAGEVESPRPYQTNWYTRFDFTLPAGTYDVVYYESLEPDETASPDARASIVVTPTGPIDVIEYFNARLGHYFMTADATEIARLDDGTIGGWTRTGESFKAVTPDQELAPVAMCRLYGLPSAGLDTHLYSDRASECDSVLARWPGAWLLESKAAFRLWSYYWCEDDNQVRIYRVYNNRADVNHRYTTSTAVRDEMIARGWILEANVEGWWSCTK